ncbi:hypothetical protein [Novosphingobium sp. 9]|uniref:hypothetical protein n=1 Tax=Novosphingobium sp. 9 TaxID=2025349 RepID=UPI0021B6134B|nr:hypothetical protein [Novosphingobium sp. 9]
MTAIRSATDFRHSDLTLSNQSDMPGPPSATQILASLGTEDDPKGLLPLPRMCLFNRHKPRSKDVVWDGTHYVGECQRCGSAIRRVRHQMWLRDWR